MTGSPPHSASAVASPSSPVSLRVASPASAAVFCNSTISDATPSSSPSPASEQVSLESAEPSTPPSVATDPLSSVVDAASVNLDNTSTGGDAGKSIRRSSSSSSTTVATLAADTGIPGSPSQSRVEENGDGSWVDKADYPEFGEGSAASRRQSVVRETRETSAVQDYPVSTDKPKPSLDPLQCPPTQYKSVFDSPLVQPPSLVVAHSLEPDPRRYSQENILSPGAASWREGYMTPTSVSRRSSMLLPQAAVSDASGQGPDRPVYVSVLQPPPLGDSASVHSCGHGGLRTPLVQSAGHSDRSTPQYPFLPPQPSALSSRSYAESARLAPTYTSVLQKSSVSSVSHFHSVPTPPVLLSPPSMGMQPYHQHSQPHHFSRSGAPLQAAVDHEYIDGYISASASRNSSSNMSRRRSSTSIIAPGHRHNPIDSPPSNRIRVIGAGRRMSAYAAVGLNDEENLKGEGGRMAKIYKCPRKLCTKVYKNANGLKYHLDRGACEIDQSALSLAPSVQLRSSLNHLESTTAHSNRTRVSFAVSDLIREPSPGSYRHELAAAESFSVSASLRPAPPPALSTAFLSYHRSPSTHFSPSSAVSPATPSPYHVSQHLQDLPTPSSAGFVTSATVTNGGHVPNTTATLVEDGDAEPLKVVHRPYACRVRQCGKRYQNLNGLKYHSKVEHPELDFRQDVYMVL
ncbi:hypothetical protein DFJ73DRAFT_243076 [Zopfochytrium polystomum]|nr:hypothetical protein DFJ73DRAFT_243076 [Zopfochytrium polystomum]